MRTIKIFLIISVAIACTFFPLQGQVQVNVHVNLGSQWPSPSHEEAVYYFLPDIGVYYLVPQQIFIYPSHDRWIFSKKLPRTYHHFNIHTVRKIELHEPAPYLRHDFYTKQYRHGDFNDSHDPAWAEWDHGKYKLHDHSIEDHSFEKDSPHGHRRKDRHHE